MIKSLYSTLFHKPQGSRLIIAAAEASHAKIPPTLLFTTTQAIKIDSIRQLSTSRGMNMKIYTKTGDKGTTSLFTGERRMKNDLVFEALGATDELSSHLALAREFAKDEDHPFADRILRIQCILQDIGAVIATPKSSARESHLKKVGISQRHADELEEWIDEYTKQLTPLVNFILPGGGKTSSCLHIARTVCRRAERKVCPLVTSGEADEQVLIYLNRLSDFLFTAARLASMLEQRKETIYIRTIVPEKLKDTVDSTATEIITDEENKDNKIREPSQ